MGMDYPLPTPFQPLRLSDLETFPRMLVASLTPSKMLLKPILFQHFRFLAPPSPTQANMICIASAIRRLYAPFWHAKIAKMVVLACQNCQNGDFGMPESPKWRFWHAKIPILTILACQNDTCKSESLDASKARSLAASRCLGGNLEAKSISKIKKACL